MPSFPKMLKPDGSYFFLGFSPDFSPFLRRKRLFHYLI
jgi:hypothetical protein